ncbi:hypothetical protein [Cohnella rhizosphaerae]|uniref:Uncharacterized protein n=1 Tax=Cohnella rhizosphaerae TaxID=1457232 RepID=A0A9X4KRA3_9BACL|nr:hypothetical protein [Cohnella rhizosphaerae]MDG0809208.1 hypothetical protein [Cohnella rhizosphaerae]
MATLLAEGVYYRAIYLGPVKSNVKPGTKTSGMGGFNVSGVSISLALIASQIEVSHRQFGLKLKRMGLD